MVSGSWGLAANFGQDFGQKFAKDEPDLSRKGFCKHTDAKKSYTHRSDQQKQDHLINQLYHQHRTILAWLLLQLNQSITTTKMRSVSLLFVAALASASAQDAYNHQLRGDRMLSVATAKASKASSAKSSKT